MCLSWNNCILNPYHLYAALAVPVSTDKMPKEEQLMERNHSVAVGLEYGKLITLLVDGITRGLEMKVHKLLQKNILRYMYSMDGMGVAQWQDLLKTIAFSQLYSHCTVHQGSLINK